MGKGCRGATHQGQIRGTQRNLMIPTSAGSRSTWQGARATHEPGRPTPPDQAKAEAWLPAARANLKSGPRSEGAMGADARNRLVWLGPFTHHDAEARSESCPPPARGSGTQTGSQVSRGQTRSARAGRAGEGTILWCTASGPPWPRRGLRGSPGVWMVFARP
jgi:hypothetical protein